MTLADFPASVKLRNGDSVLLYGTVARNRLTTRGQTSRLEVTLVDGVLAVVMRDGAFAISLMERPKRSP